MKTFSLEEAKKNPQNFFHEIEMGEEVTLTNEAQTIAKVTPVINPVLKERKAGSLKGKIWMAEDFDEPLEDFKEYME